MKVLTTEKSTGGGKGRIPATKKVELIESFLSTCKAGTVEFGQYDSTDKISVETINKLNYDLHGLGTVAKSTGGGSVGDNFCFANASIPLADGRLPLSKGILLHAMTSEKVLGKLTPESRKVAMSYAKGLSDYATWSAGEKAINKLTGKK